MPTYEYWCEKCGEKMEFFSHYFKSNDHEEVCPKCGTKMYQKFWFIGVAWKCKHWNNELNRPPGKYLPPLEDK